MHDITAFPAALRELLEAELNTGNTIVKGAATYPARPPGVWVMLARPVSTRPRDNSDGVMFYERNSSSYSGEFSDLARQYFVVEPPLAPPHDPDMNAIRAELKAQERASDEEFYDRLYR